MTGDAREHNRFRRKTRGLLLLLLFSPLFLFSLMAEPFFIVPFGIGVILTTSFSSDSRLSSRKSALRVMTILSSLSLFLSVVALVLVLQEVMFDSMLEVFFFFLLCSAAAYFVVPAAILVSADRIFQMRLLSSSVSISDRDWAEPIVALVVAVASYVLGLAAFCLSPLFSISRLFDML